MTKADVNEADVNEADVAPEVVNVAEDLMKMIMILVKMTLLRIMQIKVTMTIGAQTNTFNSNEHPKDEAPVIEVLSRGDYAIAYIE